MKVETLQAVGTVVNTAVKHRTAAIILAAGNSSRMGGTNKQTELVNGVPVLAHTLMAYQRCTLINRIIVVARPQDFDAILEMSKTYGIRKLTNIVRGGKTRQESALRGLARLDEKVKYVAIADGARCLTTPEQIAKVCLSAYRYNAASAAHRISDTVKRTGSSNMTKETVDRKDLWAVQTPQVFHTSLYTAAIMRTKTDKVEVTDDNALIENLGFGVHLVECGAANLKITTKDDLPMAEAILVYRQTHKPTLPKLDIGKLGEKIKKFGGEK